MSTDTEAMREGRSCPQDPNVGGSAFALYWAAGSWFFRYLILSKPECDRLATDPNPHAIIAGMALVGGISALALLTLAWYRQLPITAIIGAIALISAGVMLTTSAR
jgi:hypothetical protein